MNNLIWIHNNLAEGDTDILLAEETEYIAPRNGINDQTGLISYINISDTPKEHWVKTKWKNTIIKDYTGHSD